ncbi:3-methyl-2-oxobutanoate hydroxymethyltransferase [Lentibacillus halophilus]|uniref:3-methyl-2-oxobutanoate hydroxymethyltransferase n=1 Tax=Lentibacillus halophilus TaxID=295065 RepID=A0ABN0Z2C2_9BACI
MLSVLDLKTMKENNEKLSMVTAYDYPSAKQAEQAEMDMILVGDSVGMVVLGYESTVEVTMDDMIHHAKAVKRGAPNTFTAVDMPFMSYHISLEDSLRNAKRLFQETNAQCLKIEGNSAETPLFIQRLAEAGIPVIAHLGLTPQTVNVLGGFKVQGKNKDAGEKLLNDAKTMADCGAAALVLECVPKELAEMVTNAISIPTIGIGAGSDCDGQVLVYHDILKYGVDRLPKFVKSFADFNDTGTEALQSYISEVKQKNFPDDAHSFLMKHNDSLPDNGK